MLLPETETDLVLSDTFWSNALATTGHRDVAPLNRWRSERYEYALLQIGRLKWLGRAAIGEATMPPSEVATATKCATDAAALGRVASGGHDLGVLSPALLTHGTLENRPFLVRQWIEGQPAACDEAELAAVCEGLRHYRTNPLPRDYVDKWHTGRRPGINHLIAVLERWAHEIRETFDASPLLDVVRRPPDGIQLAFSHGRLVPANLIRNDEGLWLVDFEEASALRAEFFDAAYCYYALRILPGTLSPGGFAVHFKKRLRFGERRGLRQAVRWHLAGLLIGGFREHHYGRTRIPRLNLELLTRDVVRKDLPV